jgi:hypothetical protein
MMDSKAFGNIQVWTSVTSSITLNVEDTPLKYHINPAYDSSPIAYSWPNPGPFIEIRKLFQIYVPSGIAANRATGGQVSAPGCTCSDLILQGSSPDGTYFTAYTKVSWLSTTTSWPTTLPFSVTVEFGVGDPGPNNG